ncbi:MAG: aspartate/glutamate racemase family protein [Methanospirillaceae archaeon]|nr:aspartate/glutamate racemase family protein [Methanospirillaceae archaeon]
MKTIGVIGGIGWSSTIVYYRLLNERVNRKKGENYSANILMYSINFGTFSQQERLAEKGNWNILTDTMLDAAERLKYGGADFIIICSNTMHTLADAMVKHTGLPVIHIADATGTKIQKAGMRKVGLIGTKYTMEQGFFRNILLNRYNVSVIIPDESEREIINTVIFDELVKNILQENSKEKYLTIIDNLIRNGAEGIVLACTEIPLLIEQDDVSVPVFDTLTIHAEAAVDYALNLSV